MLLILQRIIKLGWFSLKRNGSLTFATIFVMVMAISLVTSFFLLQKTTQVLVQTLEEKMNMYVYFNEDLSGEEVLGIQDELSKMPEVKSIEYVSREEALARFTARHQQDQAIIESLEELGTNPLLASLIIRADKAAQYAAISNFLDNSSLKELVAKVDYQQKKPAIDKLFSITANFNKTGIIFGIVLAIVAVLLAFNTTRLSIYNAREEIETMRLVGASNWFIRGPFLAQGIIAGLAASLITLLFFGVGLFFLSPSLKYILPEFNIFHYFLNNLLFIFLIQLGAGIGLGIVSSWIAVRKYLKI